MDKQLLAAARCALDVLIVIRDYDQDSGIIDPDVDNAVEKLESAIARAQSPEMAADQKTPAKLRTNRWGFKPQERLRVLEGRLAGATVRFIGVSNATDIHVNADGALTTVRADHVERIYA
jgi:hypothetical protein